ncbi:MAG: extracellular solute-binding protein [Clostridia bacterium]|nr:extracellular solute-binding protein [Clostridia bacterium]
MKNTKRSMVGKRALRFLAFLFVLILGATSLTACNGGLNKSKSSKNQIAIYSNADDEAIEVMKKTLDENGYKGKYTIKTFGTSELGGKMFAEGKDMEADMICMSSFYVESAQQKVGDMFVDLDVQKKASEEYASYYRPVLANQGAIFYNTKEIKQAGVDVPKSIKELADSKYKGLVSVPDITGSSTAWLMIQAIINEYGEAETKNILNGIYKNAGDNLEQSGSGPIKKVLAGEAVIGFGLRHQAVVHKADGNPIDYVDPIEGDFLLTEGMAVLNHDDADKVKLAKEMANCIIEKGRAGMMEYYPVALYDGEVTDKQHAASNTKKFSEPLTVELLKKHTEISESAK